MSNRFLIHVGRDDKRVTYDFDVDKMLNVEAIAIEKKTGLGFGPLMAGLGVKSLISITAIVWILQKRSDPRLQFDDVTFALGEVLIEDPDDDLEEDEPAAPKAKPAKKAS